ncbi:hypothetical protein J1D01_08460 [Seonamhaeicola sp. NFXS20]|uniref:hypothetical protein n=1 Tax=Seonamhaeicola sp. NFXS20 TaxID=2816959 RepID=UPI003B8B6A9C
MKTLLKLRSYFLLFFVLSCCGQETEKEIIETEYYSSYNNTELKVREEVEKSTIKYDSIIKKTLSLIGLPDADIEIRKTRRFGAYASISKNCKRRFFLYNEAFFDSVVAVTNSYTPIKSICYHEIGHHLYRHPLIRRREIKRYELQADRFSGFQMRLLGATLEESIAAMKHFGDDEDTNTHPNKFTRMKEIEAGYIDASIRVFNETKYIERDSLLQNAEIMYAFQEVTKLNKDFKGFNKNDFEKNGILSLEISIKLELYNFLGSIIISNKNDEIFDLATNEKIGVIIKPYPDAKFEFLKIDTSTYKIEDGIIYSMNQIGIPIKLGTKIN